jgi:hypothetical protein
MPNIWALSGFAIQLSQLRVPNMTAAIFATPPTPSRTATVRSCCIVMCITTSYGLRRKTTDLAATHILSYNFDARGVCAIAYLRNCMNPCIIYLSFIYKSRQGDLFMGQPKKQSSPRKTGLRRSHLLLKLARRVNGTSPIKVATTKRETGKKVKATVTPAAKATAKKATKKQPAAK